MASRKKTKAKKAPIARAKKKVSKSKKYVGTCFVLMPFKEPFDSYYSSIIRPAVTSARLEPLRGDSLFRPSPIVADIWKMIQDAKVLVADLTEKNANVFYELGLAHALGKPVVLVADNLADVPFDLQSLRVIIYEKNNPSWGVELKTAITASLDETLGDAVSAVPTMFRKVVKSQAPADSHADGRLESLERQVAALSTGNRRFGPAAIRSTNELRERLARARSRDEAIDLARRGRFGGMPSMLIRRIVQETIHDSQEANAVLSGARILGSGRFSPS